MPPFLPLPLPPAAQLAPPPAAPRQPSAAALIQRHGPPPAGGRASGGVSRPLERASDGDTPVLTFKVAAGSSADGAPVRLLLDTGASASMVTPALVQRLALKAETPPGGATALAGGGLDCAGLKPALVALPALEMASTEPGTASATAPLRFEGVHALVLPVGALPAGIDGVLGIPSLRQLPIRIDPQRRLLQLGPPALIAPAAAGAPLRLPLEWRRGVPVVRLRGPGGAVDALADSGAEGLFVSPELARRLQPRGPGAAVRLVGVCGEQTVQRRPLSGLDVAGLARARQPVWQGIITANPIFRLLGVEAIVGQELLRDHPQLWRLDLPRPRLELW